MKDNLVLGEFYDNGFNVDQTQVGFSDLETGIAVVFMQDWEDNGVAEKLAETVARALFVIDQLSAD